MRYYEAEPPRRTTGGLRIVVLGVVIVAFAALIAFLWVPGRDDDDVTSGTDTSGSAPLTSNVVVATTADATVPPVTATVALPSDPSGATVDPAQLVEDCVNYVPTAIYFGNVYMKAIWDIGGQTPEGLRRVCEDMLTSDPEGLQRMSNEYHDLQNLADSATPTTG